MGGLLCCHERKPEKKPLLRGFSSSSSSSSSSHKKKKKSDPKKIQKKKSNHSSSASSNSPSSTRVKEKISSAKKSIANRVESTSALVTTQKIGDKDVEKLAQIVKQSLQHCTATLVHLNTSFFGSVSSYNLSLSVTIPCADPTMPQIAAILEEYSSIQQKAKETIAEIACGKSLKSVQDISKMGRSLSFKWKGNGSSSMCALTEWNFVESATQWSAIPDKGTVGTCFRLVQGDQRTSHLLNVYTAKINGQIILRSAIVDTRQRALQLGSVMNKLLSVKGSPTRVRSLSLISTSDLLAAEKQMAHLQHGQILELNKDTNKLEFCHLNYQTNLNELMGASIGEKSSRKLNTHGLLIYVKWFLADVSSLLTDPRYESLVTPQSRGLLQKALASHQSAFKNGDESVIAITTALIKDLEALNVSLEALAKTAPPAATASHKVSRASLLLCALLKSHTTPGKMSRVQELAVLSFLDVQLDIVSCMNCKSGCDRTGLAFALNSALLQLASTRSNDMHHLLFVILHLDELNSTLSKKDSSHEKWTEYLTQLEESAKQHNQSGEDAHRLLLLVELKNCVLGNMMAVGWKVIIFSTGVPGFKFGAKSSVVSNPHVTPIMPPFVTCNNTTLKHTQFWKILIGFSIWRGGVLSQASKEFFSGPSHSERELVKNNSSEGVSGNSNNSKDAVASTPAAKGSHFPGHQLKKPIAQTKNKVVKQVAKIKGSLPK